MESMLHMNDKKCYFCEDKSSSFTHVSCFVKASARQLFTEQEIWAFIRYMSKGGSIKISFGTFESRNYNQFNSTNAKMRRRLK